MTGSDRQAPSHATAAETASPPELLAPRLRLLPSRSAAGAVIAVILGVGAAAMLFGDHTVPLPHPDAPGAAANSDKVFSIATDQAPGAFKVLPANFQNAPASVLAQLNMPEAEKQRLAEKLADRSVRLAAVTLWDSVDEDGDTVDVVAAGFSQRLVIMHKPKIFFLPVQPGGSVVITAVRDGGGGGVTLGVSTVLGPLRLPPLAPGQSVEIPAL